MISKSFLKSFILLSFLITQNITAQSTEPLVITRITDKIILDGIIDEPVWNTIKPLQLLMFVPNAGQESSEKSEVYLAYDDEYFYVAAKLFDNEPDKIQAPTKKRDDTNASNDFFGLQLDTFNDNENGMGFYTTPTGIRTDGAVSNDGASGNFTWNTFWDVATSQDNTGWFAEFRIPLSSLRFHDGEKVTMGLILARLIARKFEFDTFPALPAKWGFDGINKVSLAQKIIFENIKRRNPIYVTPYFLGGLSKSFSLNENKNIYIGKSEHEIEGGLDVKVGLTSNLTLDLTLNTDFAQVEADDQQINLTRFSLYFPEKRLFFQEQSAIFDYNFGGQTRIFYSRKIGLHDGKSVRILGGARIVGKISEWDVGFINMQTEKSEKLPSENFGVLRLKKQILNPYSYIGSIFTTRLGTNGSSNFVYGLDSKLRVTEDDELLVNWSQCFDNTAPDYLPVFNFSRFRLGWERRSVNGIGLLINIVRRGNDFNPRIGFEMLKNYGGVAAKVKYGWIPEEHSSLQSHYIYQDGYVLLRNSDNSLLTSSSSLGWGFNGKSGSTGECAVFVNRESIRDTFTISNKVIVPPKEYTFFGLKGNYQTPPGDLLSSLFTLETGYYYDGFRFSLKAEPSWFVTPNIYLSGGYEFNWINFSNRNQELTSHILRIKLLATLHIAFSVSAFIQYNSVNKTIISNVRLRYNPKEGTDIYLVYNSDFNTNRDRETLMLPFYINQTILFKCSYTFDL